MTRALDKPPESRGGSGPGASFPATVDRVERGARFCGIFASRDATGDMRLLSLTSDDGALMEEEIVLPVGEKRFSSLVPVVPAASWYEREIHDLFGLEPVGHPRLDPLVFPGLPGVPPPLGPSGTTSVPVELAPAPLPAHVHGEGMFTIPYGPVRSGVFETVEYLVETAGEDIPHLRTRIFYKHRGLDARFEGMSVDDGALLAERVEGVASVAHALAYSGAVERLAGLEVPLHAELVRVVHAELERMSNHLDTIVRHTEGAGQAVAYACFSHHKERVQRLRTRLCGNRFGRGIVVPGGVRRPLRLRPVEVVSAIDALQRVVDDDLRRLMDTPSFIDRLRGTGCLDASTARAFALVGPVGRASAQTEDVRTSRPYSAYGRLEHLLVERRDEGDALARQRVRIEEIAGSFHLVRQAVDVLGRLGEPESWRVPFPQVSGRVIGWAEAPQGELLSVVEVRDGRLVRTKQRSASFHNLGAYSSAYPKDIFTDVAFIEASFGLSIAGAAG